MWHQNAMGLENDYRNYQKIVVYNPGAGDPGAAQSLAHELVNSNAIGPASIHSFAEITANPETIQPGCMVVGSGGDGTHTELARLAAQAGGLYMPLDGGSMGLIPKFSRLGRLPSEEINKYVDRMVPLFNGKLEHYFVPAGLIHDTDNPENNRQFLWVAGKGASIGYLDHIDYLRRRVGRIHRIVRAGLTYVRSLRSIEEFSVQLRGENHRVVDAIIAKFPLHPLEHDHYKPHGDDHMFLVYHPSTIGKYWQFKYLSDMLRIGVGKQPTSALSKITLAENEQVIMHASRSFYTHTFQVDSELYRHNGDIEVTARSSGLPDYCLVRAKRK